MTSLDEIKREFERLHQLMRELNTLLEETQTLRRQMDTLLEESLTLRRHIGVAMARLALCLREAEDEPQDDHL
jgi:regulator of replication initiation timing